MIDDIILPKFSFFFQCNDYRAGSNRVVKDKCKKQDKSLRKCYAKHGGSARKCRRKAKRAKKCWKENEAKKEESAQQVEMLHIRISNSKRNY